MRVCVCVQRADNQDLNKMAKNPGNVNFIKRTTINVPNYNYKQIKQSNSNLPKFQQNQSTNQPKQTKNQTSQKNRKPKISTKISTQTCTRVCDNN